MKMPPIAFVGVLSNVDSSILGLDLGEGTTIERSSRRDAIELIAEIEGTTSSSLVMRSLFGSACLNVAEESVYFVRRKLKWVEDPPAIDQDASVAKPASDDSLVRLDSRIRLARLFHRGNLSMPLQYGYTEEGGVKQFVMAAGAPSVTQREPFSVSAGEMGPLNRFIATSTLPLTPEYVDLAFRAFELSYSTLGTGLPFLSAWWGLEALLNPSDVELRYRLSRGVGMLLAHDENEYRVISKEMKRLYDKRSAFIHGGVETTIDSSDVLLTRERLRQTILRVSALQISKDKLVSKLDSAGFGRL
jgi:hypothetical protein